MKPTRFHPDAEAELIAAVAHYEDQRPGLGVDLRDEVEAAVGMLRARPEMFAVRPLDGLRKCPVRQFPYSIYYLELASVIWIAAVAHQSRKPGYWSGRSPIM